MEMKSAVNVAEVDFEKTEEFFRRFRVEKLKTIHRRIKENQQYLRSTMKILHADKENFVKVLGFDKNERKVILYDILESYKGLETQIGKINLEQDEDEASEEEGETPDGQSELEGEIDNAMEVLATSMIDRANEEEEAALMRQVLGDEGLDKLGVEDMAKTRQKEMRGAGGAQRQQPSAPQAHQIQKAMLQKHLLEGGEVEDLSERIGRQTAHYSLRKRIVPGGFSEQTSAWSESQAASLRTLQPKSARSLLPERRGINALSWQAPDTPI